MNPSAETAVSESLSEAEAIAQAEAEMAGFAAERDACVKRCRELLAAEDPLKGVFHAAEIFSLQRDKLRLEVEMEFRRKRINRIRLGIEQNAAPARGGMPF